MRAGCSASIPHETRVHGQKVLRARTFNSNSFVQLAPTCLHPPHRFWSSSPQPLRAQHTRCLLSPPPAASPPLAPPPPPLSPCGIVAAEMNCWQHFGP
jgi:hypothetical protein